MEYFLMPVDRDDYYSANSRGGVGPWTYVRSTGEPHGHGRLDMALNREGPIYSMTDGKVIGVGHFSGDDSAITYCNIEYYDTTLNEKVVIRYLHGDYIVQENQEVSCGQQIGTIGNNDLGNLQHLHIDFQDTPPYYYEHNTMVGTLDFSHRTFTYKNVVYNLKGRVDLTKIGMWNQQMGLSASNTSIGYCWLIFAQSDQHLSPIPQGGIEINKEVYEQCAGPGENQNGVDFYFEGVVNDNFCGPYPENWDIVNSEECKGLRRMVNVCYHEFGSIGKFAFVSFAKLLRSGFCCDKIIYSNWGLNASTLDEMIVNVSTNSQFIGTLADNTDVLKPGITLDEIKAIYNNFKYPNIFGSELHGNDPENYKELIIKGINSLPAMNGFQESGSYKGYTKNYPAYPPYFLTAYYYPTKQEVYNGQLDYGTFIFYRYINQVHEPNPKVL